MQDSYIDIGVQGRDHMYLLLSRYRSFSTQIDISKCLLGFDQRLKPRDRCSNTKNIKRISKSSYLTRLPKIYHQVPCELIVPSLQTWTCLQVDMPTAHNDIRWVTPVNCGGGILLSSQTQDTGSTVTIKTISSNLASQISVNHAAVNTTSTTCTEHEKVWGKSMWMLRSPRWGTW